MKARTEDLPCPTKQHTGGRLEGIYLRDIKEAESRRDGGCLDE